MSIFTKLRKLEGMSTNQQALADFIITKPNLFLTLKPKEISEKAYVSVSTIYRLLDRLDLNGINQLKVEVAASLNEGRENVNTDFPILPTDSHYETIKNLHQLYSQTIDESCTLFDLDDLDNVVELLINAKQIDVYSSSANCFFAQNFQFQMQEIGVYVNTPIEDYMQVLSAANSEKNHIAIVVSYEGRSRTTNNVVRILNENSIPLILISSYHDNPLREFAQHTIDMSSLENHYNKISSFSTRLGLLYVFDVLYSIYFKKNYERNLNYKLTNYRKMNKQLK